MKLTDYLARWLHDKGVRHVFGVSGGAVLHIMHSINDHAGLTLVPTQHEQAAGFAADAYARLNGIGCAVATSGPGFTNLLTAIASSYYDSIPTLYIVGNAARTRSRTRLLDLGVVDIPPRCVGFQEAPNTEISKPITKSALEIASPESFPQALEFAFKVSRAGRPGPALISIPDDVQRADVTT